MLVTRTVLLHSMRMCPEMVSVALWPMAFAHTCRRYNELDFEDQGVTPLERFSGVRKDIDPSIYHTWGSPIYVLDDRLQSGLGSAPKWDPRSRLGVYLGASPFHASSVVLVLNPTLGISRRSFTSFLMIIFRRSLICERFGSHLIGRSWSIRRAYHFLTHLSTCPRRGQSQGFRLSRLPLQSFSTVLKFSHIRARILREYLWFLSLLARMSPVLSVNLQASHPLSLFSVPSLLDHPLPMMKYLSAPMTARRPL